MRGKKKKKDRGASFTYQTLSLKLHMYNWKLFSAWHHLQESRQAA